jgi:hypothetical protein
VQWFLPITSELIADQVSANKRLHVFALVHSVTLPAFQVLVFTLSITQWMFQRFFQMELLRQHQFQQRLRHVGM